MSDDLPLKDFYVNSLRNVTEACLRAFSSAVTADPLSRNITFVLQSLESHYDGLNYYADKDSNTISYLLFPSWRNSLEKPILFLGDIHPYLLTNLLRSLINRVNQDSGETASKDPYVVLLKRIDELEAEIGPLVADLLDRMSKTQIRFAARFSDSWVTSYGSQWGTVMATTASMAIDETAKEEIMKELVSIFVDANLLRKKLIKDIVEATRVKILTLASLFLESLCRIFAGFQDHQGHEFQNTLSASPLMSQHRTASISSHHLTTMFRS